MGQKKGQPHKKNITIMDIFIKKTKKLNAIKNVKKPTTDNSD